jgi:hypothetical protein
MAVTEPLSSPPAIPFLIVATPLIDAIRLDSIPRVRNRFTHDALRVENLLRSGLFLRRDGCFTSAAGCRYPPRVSAEDTFDLAAAGLRGDGTDLAISVEVLASKLEQALPGLARVERRGGGLLGRGEKRVRSVQVELSGCCYQLTVDGPRVQGFRERQSGGIAIKREALDPTEWIAALGADLRAEAERSAQARAALEELLR